MAPRRLIVVIIVVIVIIRITISACMGRGFKVVKVVIIIVLRGDVYF